MKLRTGAQHFPTLARLVILAEHGDGNLDRSRVGSERCEYLEFLRVLSSWLIRARNSLLAWLALTNSARI